MGLGTRFTESAMPPALILSGLKLLWHPELRWLVLTPLLINAGLFFGVTLSAFAVLDDWLSQIMIALPTWLEWLKTLVWILFAGLALVVYAFGFTLLAHLIGSPFYGLIAERVLNLSVEANVTPSMPRSGGSAISIASQSFLRQLDFLKYLLPRSLGIVLLTFGLGFVPGLNLVSPFILASWTAWVLALQYLDYPSEAAGVPFGLLKAQLGQDRGRAMSFGFSALLVSAIPLLNLILVPATVVAGALFWRQSFQPKKA